MVVLATAAAVIASQAIISGAFSLTMQAIQLGYIPRLKVNYTSERIIGQIYVPVVNWALMLCCIGLVLGFRISSHLAAAYGVAITTTMLITTILFYFVARRRWHWPAAQPCRWPRSSSSSISRFSARTCSRSRMAAGSRCSFRASFFFSCLRGEKGVAFLRGHLGDICLPLDAFPSRSEEPEHPSCARDGDFHVGQPIRHTARVAPQSQAQQSAA